MIDENKKKKTMYLADSKQAKRERQREKETRRESDSRRNEP